MKVSPLLTKYGGIDSLDINVRTEYIDNRWLFYVEIIEADIKFCIESQNLEDAIQSLVQSSLEHMHWHLEKINNES